MGKTAIESKLINLEDLNANQIVNVSKWEAEQEQIIKDNPFIEITDNETYIIAKSHRTNLLKGRTSLLGKNGQEGIIRSTFKTILNGSISILEDLANKTEPHYNEQQEEVKRWEAVIEEKRQERLKKAEEERLAEELRIETINKNIDAIYDYFKNRIDAMTFESIEDIKSEFWDKLKKRDTSEFEEYEITFNSNLDRLEAALDEKIESLIEAENQRLEKIKLAEERAKFEEEKAKTREEERKRQAIVDADNKKKSEQLAKEQAKIDAEKERLQQAEKERLEKERLEKEKKEQVKLEKARVKREKALLPDKQKAIEQIESLQITIVNQVKDKDVQIVLNDLVCEISVLKDKFTSLINSI